MYGMNACLRSPARTFQPSARTRLAHAHVLAHACADVLVSVFLSIPVVERLG